MKTTKLIYIILFVVLLGLTSCEKNEATTETAIELVEQSAPMPMSLEGLDI